MFGRYQLHQTTQQPNLRGGLYKIEFSVAKKNNNKKNASTSRPVLVLRIRTNPSFLFSQRLHVYSVEML